MTKKVISNAIVLFSRSWSALAAVRSLGKKGVDVYTGDTVSGGAATFSKYSKESFIYPDPSEEKKFINYLIKYCEQIFEKNRGEILIIPIHEETYTLSKHKHKFPFYVNFVMPKNSILQKINNKGEFIKIAKKYKINTPYAEYCKNIEQAEETEPNLTYPIFLKDPDSSGSTGIYKATNKKQYLKITRKLKKNFVVQSHAPGKDYCCCTLFNKGKPIILFTYTALRTYPPGGGSTVFRKTVQEPEIEKQTIKLLSKLKWTGVAELDFRKQKNKKPLLIEVNPRFWGGLNQATRSNVDFPYLLLRIAEGEKLSRIKKFPKNIQTANFGLVLASTIKEMQKNNRMPEIKKKIATLKKNPNKKNLLSLKRTLDNYNKKLYKDVKYIAKNYPKKRVFEDFYDKNDPQPTKGLLFPLQVYKKYGKINEKLLIRSSAKEGLK